VVVFPLGLITGYLMRTTRGILASMIFHAGTDIPIYLAFLSFVSTP
jgi:membrane protease YdiL (CAAX protease family)